MYPVPIKRTIKETSVVTRKTDRQTDRQREREKEMIKISGGLKKPANKSTDIIKRGY